MDIIEKAYAKINLCLDSKHFRDDGFHELESVILPLKFHDTIDFSILPKGITDDFITCDSFSMRVSKYNLCHKMVAVLREKYQFKEHFNIKIHKNIFVQSGLGGGSADACAVFRCVIKYLKLELSDGEIKEICNKVGSDCYFQFYNKPALVKGRGDNVEFFDYKSDNLILLVAPNTGNSTETIFKESDKMELVHGDSLKVKDTLLNGDLNELGKVIFNSLYEPAKKLNPDVETIKKILDEKGFECVSMTGSGSCVFAISKNKKLIKRTAMELDKKGYFVEVTTFLKQK